MLTQTMARNPVDGLGHVAAHALHLFYQAHIWASAKGKVSFEMDRRLLMKALKISRSTATRVIAELIAAELIVKHGRRALHKTCRYRLVFPSEAAVEAVDNNDGLQEASATNRANVLMGEPDRAHG
jgi:DNA-binding MarR family transcriptional regulator